MDGNKRFTTASLNEAVRLYVAAMYHRYRIRPFEYPVDVKSAKGEVIEELEFGVSDMRAVGDKYKSEKRRKKRKVKKVSKPILERNPELARSLYASVEPLTNEELKHLENRAREALAIASGQAGKQMIYCCAMIRLADYECPIDRKHNFVYDKINSWQDEQAIQDTLSYHSMDILGVN